MLPNPFSLSQTSSINVPKKVIKERTAKSLRLKNIFVTFFQVSNFFPDEFETKSFVKIVAGADVKMAPNAKENLRAKGLFITKFYY